MQGGQPLRSCVMLATTVALCLSRNRQMVQFWANGVSATVVDPASRHGSLSLPSASSDRVLKPLVAGK